MILTSIYTNELDEIFEKLDDVSKISNLEEYPLELDQVSGWALPMAYIQQKTGKDFIKKMEL